MGPEHGTGERPNRAPPVIRTRGGLHAARGTPSRARSMHVRTHHSRDAECPKPRAKRPACLRAGSQPALEAPRQATLQASAGLRATARARVPTRSRGRRQQRAPRHEGAAASEGESQQHGDRRPHARKPPGGAGIGDCAFAQTRSISASPGAPERRVAQARQGGRRRTLAPSRKPGSEALLIEATRVTRV